MWADFGYDELETRRAASSSFKDEVRRVGMGAGYATAFDQAPSVPDLDWVSVSWVISRRKRYVSWKTLTISICH